MLTARFNNSCCSPTPRSAPGRASAHNLSALMESMFSGVTPGATARTFPAINVVEDADNFHVEAELPGFTIDDLDISLTDNLLTIAGERKLDVPAGSEVLRRERPAGKFSRTLKVAVEVDAQHVAAKLKDGILTVTLPKAPQVKPRKISVTPA
ncbi:MAG: Hsp20/alpha crystallin family protein [Pyrinomonadaceae bacterium]|nr:Hsp20/alpha crystallin family protein [Phycisphaerales bacterium]